MDNANTQLIIESIRQLGTAVEGMRTTLMGIPDQIETKLEKHRELCPAYRHWDEMQNRQTEITGVINVHEERLRALKERKVSISPRRKSPWWGRLLIPAITAIGTILATCAFTVRCSSGQQPSHAQIAQTQKHAE